MSRLVCIFWFAAILAFTACSSNEPEPLPVFQATSPIEELLGVPIDPAEAAEWDATLSAAAIERCMSAKGYDYSHDPTLVGGFTTVVPGESVPQPELATIDGARSMLDLLVSKTGPGTDPNFDGTENQSERDDWSQALFGRPQAPGCLQEGEAAVVVDPGRNRALVSQFNEATQAAYASDPNTVAGAAAWNTCMAQAGHEWETPTDAHRHFLVTASATGELSNDDLTASPEALTARIIADVEPIAAAEAIVAATSERCAKDWLAARAAVRSAVADDFVARLS